MQARRQNLAELLNQKLIPIKNLSQNQPVEKVFLPDLVTFSADTADAEKEEKLAKGDFTRISSEDILLQLKRARSLQRSNPVKQIQDVIQATERFCHALERSDTTEENIQALSNTMGTILATALANTRISSVFLVDLFNVIPRMVTLTSPITSSQAGINASVESAETAGASCHRAYRP